MTQVETQLGVVRKIKIDEEVPEGWRVLTLVEGNIIKDQLK